MNSQTKSVSLAVLIGLVFSLAPAIGTTWEFDRYDIFNPNFLGYWVGRYGMFPLLFVFITIVLKSDEFSFVFLRRLRFGDGRRPIAL